MLEVKFVCFGNIMNNHEKLLDLKPIFLFLILFVRFLLDSPIKEFGQS